MKEENPKVTINATPQVQEIDSDPEGAKSGSFSEDEDEEDEPKKRHGPEPILDKKAHKKKVKEEQREKRKNKMPKHVKKRKEKVGNKKK